MRLLLTNLSLPFNAPDSMLKRLIANQTGLPVDVVGRLRIVHRSLDARDKGDIRYLYSVTLDVSETDGRRVLARRLGNVSVAPEEAKPELIPGSIPQPAPIVVVGLGPGGLFAAYELARLGYGVIVLERGKPISERKRDVDAFWSGGEPDPNSNIMFGEGGAGAFSDGKLTTRIKDARADDVVETLVRFGAEKSIAVDAKPHVGTDMLSDVIMNMRRELVRLGVDIRFNSCMTDFTSADGRITSVTVNGQEKIPCCAVILAIGQAARDTYRMLLSRGVELVQKPFAVGVRIEHPQEFINRSQFGSYAGHPRLGAAEYRLTGKTGDRGVYTFCMCPGGVVVASSSDREQVVTNGMSYHARDGRNANSAIIVQVNPSDFGSDPLAGLVFQEKIERAAFRLGGGDYRAPAIRVGDFLSGKKPTGFGAVTPTYRPGVVPADIRRCFPAVIGNGIADGIRAFSRRIKGFDMYDAVLTAVESRSSSPVRIQRTESGEATRVKGLYPVGEGAGYAGGIVSAAVDGIKAAEKLISAYAPVH